MKLSALSTGAVALLLALSGPASAATLTVGALTDIWLAGQPDGSSITGFFGSDTAPDNSPVLVAVTAGQALRFAASGSTSVDASCFAGPNGGCYADESSFGVGPDNGVGTYKGPSNALIGVFVGSTQPSGTGAPASLDYTDANNLSLPSNAPALGQIFVIGDGLTASSTVKQFVAPAGATRLFLAVADSYGSSTGNVGSLDVSVSAVPEPASALLMLGGLVGLGLRARRRGAVSAG